MFYMGGAVISWLVSSSHDRGTLCCVLKKTCYSHNAKFNAGSNPVMD